MALIKSLILTGGSSRSSTLLIDNVIVDLLEWDKNKPVQIKLDGRKLVVTQEQQQKKRGPKPKSKVLVDEAPAE